MYCVTEDRFMVALPPSVGTRVIVLPVLSTCFELLSPAVFVAGLPVGRGEYLNTRTRVWGCVLSGLTRQLLGFVTARSKTCQHGHGAGKKGNSFEAVHDLAPFESALLP